MAKISFSVTWENLKFLLLEIYFVRGTRNHCNNLRDDLLYNYIIEVTTEHSTICTGALNIHTIMIPKNIGL